MVYRSRRRDEDTRLATSRRWTGQQGCATTTTAEGPGCSWLVEGMEGGLLGIGGDVVCGSIWRWEWRCVLISKIGLSYKVGGVVFVSVREFDASVHGVVFGMVVRGEIVGTISCSCS